MPAPATAKIECDSLVTLYRLVFRHWHSERIASRSEFSPHTLWLHLWLGGPLGDCTFSISARHKLKNALMMVTTIGPLKLAGLVATYASTSRTRSVSVELARHRWRAVLTR